MNVTQQQIDDAIALAEETIASLATQAATTLKSGCQPCEDLLDSYNKLNTYIYLLNQGFASVNAGCIETKDLWTAIQKINSMSSC